MLKEKVSYHAEWSILDFESAISLPVKRFTHFKDYDAETFNGAKMRATRLMNNDPDMKEMRYEEPRWIRWSGWSDIQDVVEHNGYVFVTRRSDFALPMSYQEGGRCQGVLYLVWRAAAARREDRMLADMIGAGMFKGGLS